MMEMWHALWDIFLWLSIYGVYRSRPSLRRTNLLSCDMQEYERQYNWSIVATILLPIGVIYHFVVFAYRVKEHFYG